MTKTPYEVGYEDGRYGRDYNPYFSSDVENDEYTRGFKDGNKNYITDDDMDYYYQKYYGFGSK